VSLHRPDQPLMWSLNAIRTPHGRVDCAVMLFSISETEMRVSPGHWKEMTLILLLKEEIFILVIGIRHMT